MTKVITVSSQAVLEAMIDSATQEWLDCVKIEKDNSFEDSMESIDRAYAQGYKEGLDMAYRFVYGEFYNSEVVANGNV